PAEAAGLAIGDMIVVAGGRRTQSPADFNSVLDLARVSGKLKIRLIRGSSEIETTLDIGQPLKHGHKAQVGKPQPVGLAPTPR
ncbi:MAG: PDZ domain-containing protein, partial [Pseudomonadota bacterium]